MARKQAAKPIKEPTLKELRTRRSFLQEALAVKQLEATTKLIESFGFYDDFPSDDLWERTRGRRFQAFPPSQPSDRKGGANWPLWRTEAELDLLRQRSRVLSKVNGYAVCLLRNLTNYVIGDGFKYKTQAKPSIDTSPEPGQQVSGDIENVVTGTQNWIDQHNERNRWNCAGNPLETQPTANTREREAFRRVLRDGECFIRLFHQEEGRTAIRFIEPELIRNPAGKNASASGWTYGIQHHIDAETGIEDVERIVAYNVRYPDGNEEVIDAAEIIHIRADDEDCTIKRGTPAFSYDTASALERASKLQRNTSTAAAIRAATAEIWEYETATQAQLTALASSLSSAKVTNPTTGQLENIEDIRPGTIRRVPQGSKKVPLDSASGVSEHLSAVQGDLRQAGAAFAAPEYITGDASNANFASTKEAGTPFVLNGESTQAHFKSAFKTVLWRCIKHAADCGRLPSNALRVVELQVEAPAIKQRDPLQKAQEDQILSPLGKSNQTILMENGLDPEVEANNKQEWEDRFGAPGMGLDMPPDMPAIPGMESRETPARWLARLLREAKDASKTPIKESAEWDENKHARDHGKFASKPGAKGEGGSGKGDDKPKDDAPYFSGPKDNPYAYLMVGGKDYYHQGAQYIQKVSEVRGAKWKKQSDQLRDDVEQVILDNFEENGEIDHDAVKAKIEEWQASFDKDWSHTISLAEKSQANWEPNDAEKKQFERRVSEARTKLQGKIDALYEEDFDFDEESDYVDEVYARADELSSTIEDAYIEMGEAHDELVSDAEQRIKEEDEAWQEEAGDLASDLNGMDQDEAEEAAAEFNAALDTQEKNGENANRYRVMYDEDDEEWKFEYYEDAGDYPGKLLESFRPRKQDGRHLIESRKSRTWKRIYEWRDFDETKVKRDHGKFAKTAGAKAEKKAKGDAKPSPAPAKAKPAKSREALNDTIATAKADPSPENLAALAEHFNAFGRRELMAIKKEMGIRATDRKKADTVKQLVEAATKRLTDRQIAERDAKAAGIPIKAMVQTAKEMRQNANIHVDRVKAAIAEAKAAYAHYNKAPLHRGRKELKAIFKDGDYDKIPHWDEIAKSVSAAFPDLKIDEGYLFDLIAGGPPRKMSYQDSYRDAIDHLHHQKQTAAADVPF